MDNDNHKFDYVIYHYPCYDGMGGAFVAFLKNKDIIMKGIEAGSILPSNYIEEMNNKRVIIIDISFKKNEIIALNKVCSKLVILDHHKTNEDELKNLDFALFDMNKSGCEMAWEYFFGQESIPDFLHYIGLRDLWRHKTNENALYFTIELKDQSLDLNTYLIYYYNLNSNVDEAIKNGKKKFDAMMDRVKEISHNMIIKEQWEGCKTYAIDIRKDYLLISEVGDYLSNIYKNAIILIYSSDVSGNKFKYSLRSNNEYGPDVSVIAKRYDGGGHKNASGFYSLKSIDELIK